MRKVMISFGILSVVATLTACGGGTHETRPACAEWQSSNCVNPIQCHSDERTGCLVCTCPTPTDENSRLQPPESGGHP